MRSKLIIGIIIILILIVGGFVIWQKSEKTTQVMNMPAAMVTPATGSSTSAVATTKITIQNFAFSPAAIKVKVGDTVTWTNEDSIGHSATADDNSWNTGVLAQGKSGSITFSKVGTFSYHCSIHPYMHGTVIVEAK